MAQGLRRVWALAVFRLQPAAALVLLAANTVVLGLIWLARVEVTPHGIDHTLDGVGDEQLYSSLPLCGDCALLLVASAVSQRQWGAVASWLGLLVVIAGSPVLVILLYYGGGVADLKGSSPLPQTGIFADGVLCYVALPAVAAVAAFRLGGPPR